MSIRSIILAFLFMVCLINVCVGETVELTYYTIKGSIKKYVDSNIEEITFGKTSNVISVSGLEKLKNLKKVTFSMTAYIADFSFLNANKNMEVLVFQDCSLPDNSFLYEQKNLKILALQGCRNISPIKLNALPKLEYFEISNSGIKELPVILHGPLENLKIVNLAFNKIASLDSTLLNYFSKCTIIMTGNPFTLQKPNISYAYLFDILPEKYHFLIR